MDLYLNYKKSCDENIIFSDENFEELKKYEEIFLDCNCEKILLYSSSKNKCSNNYYKNSSQSKRGLYGEVFRACCDENCEFILKVDKNGYNCREVISQLEASQTGLSPKIHEVWRCIKNKKDIATIIIMDKLDITLEDFLKDEKNKKFVNEIIDKVFSLLDNLHKIKIIHNDTHLQNFMIKIDKEEIKLFIIDFGKSEKTNSFFKIDEMITDFNILRDDIFQTHNLDEQIKTLFIEKIDKKIEDMTGVRKKVSIKEPEKVEEEKDITKKIDYNKDYNKNFKCVVEQIYDELIFKDEITLNDIQEELKKYININTKNKKKILESLKEELSENLKE